MKTRKQLVADLRLAQTAEQKRLAGHAIDAYDRQTRSMGWCAPGVDVCRRVGTAPADCGAYMPE